jgi:integrase/recombinase XerD
VPPKKIATKITWPEAFSLYRTHLQAKRTADSTIEGHLIELNRFRRHLGSDHPPLPGEITLQDLREYQVGLMTGSISDKPLSAGTVARISTVLRTFFAYLEDDGKIENDPARKLERPHVPPRLPGDVLTIKEVRRLLEAADCSTPVGLRNRALVELLYATGLRRSEILSLNLTSINHEEREVVVVGKGSKGRRIPITRTAYKHLMAYIERGRPSLVKKHADGASAVFLTIRGKRQERVGFASVLRLLGQRAGIKKKLTPHTLRRTFATHLLQGGASLRHIQVLLGHSDLNTTAIYLRLNPQDVRRELLLKHPRERIDV